jgi:hypothetical protein
MQSISTRIRFVAILSVCLGASSIFAQNIPPQQGLVCQADGDSVHLSWENLFIDPAIGDPNANFPSQLLRDSQVILDLATGDVSYTDVNVPTGTHVYTLVITSADGTAFTSECTVTVGSGSALRCSVDGKVVTLEWEVSPDILAFGFSISRDNVIIATVDDSARSFRDDAPTGDHTYAVSTNNRLGGVAAPDFLIGSSCRVSVGSTGGLICTVNGNTVTRVWDLTAGIFAAQIVVSRDNQIIATLPGNAHTYEDQAPPGDHIYTVTTNNAFPNPNGQIDPDIPDFLIGTCQVFVPEGFGIKCSVDGNVVTVDWDDLPIDIAIFGWFVYRNGDVVAQLDPNQTSYREDTPAGTHTYTVTAIVGFFDAAGNINENGNPFEEFVGSCQVTVGSSNLPGPANLRCSIAESFPVQVQLSWEIPTTTGYEVIVVMRDGQPIAELSGNTTFFSEFDPGAGIHIYGVFGIRNGVQSNTASCTVETPGGGLRNELALENRGGSIGANGIPGFPAIGGDTVTVVMHNAQTVQGWSFGVCSDPANVIGAATDIAGTATGALNDGAGPTFMALEVHDRGVTMGVVIDQDDPADVLTLGSYDLLQIQYEKGPDAQPFLPYPVDFCETLGEPPVAKIIVVVGHEVIPTTAGSSVIFAGLEFLRSDINNDRVVDTTDSIVLLEWLFLGRAAPPCMEAADMNGSRAVNIADPIYSLTHVLIGGDPPPAPYPDCGAAPFFFDCEHSACND